VSTIQSIRGMNDILPDETGSWQRVEDICQDLASQYGYQEIRFPLIEKTELFKRTVGEVTDIVEKEMYTFDARNGESLSLRPEGTAGCVRAVLQNGLLGQGLQRLWYQGPMYRHERPQKGRYRQFHQFSLEAFGADSSLIEVEHLAFMWELWAKLGLQDNVSLEINSLGSTDCRQRFKAALVDYLTDHESMLDEDSKRRLTTNPLRILDSKNPDMQELIKSAPQFMDYWSEQTAERFKNVTDQLEFLAIPFTVNQRLVRGLDYYSHTVYEWTTQDLGAQGTLCAGGRYDSLIPMLGGKLTGAVGFALGLERILLLLKQADKSLLKNLSSRTIYLVLMGDNAEQHGVKLARQMRQAIAEGVIIMDASSGSSFKSQFKRADKSGAAYALVLGEDEVSANTVSLKYLRDASQQQVTMPVDSMIEHLKKEIVKNG
jgi:histidyl-tRNA synthetase